MSSPSETKHQWPVKIFELQTHHMDTTRWNDFPFRPDDIIIASWGKSGTTWMQQIISQLVFLDIDDPIPHLHTISPWVDMRLPPLEPTLAQLEAQKHRRFIKTHAPLENLVLSPQAKYVFVARDGRDAIWSLHHHMFNATPMFYQLINETPGRVGRALHRPDADPRRYFLDVLKDEDDESVVPLPIWKTIRGWYGVRELPNVLIVHYNDLKTDLRGEIQRIAEFLDIEVNGGRLDGVVERCTFEYMKAHAEEMSPEQVEMVFEGGAATFINKGTNGRWRDVLIADDVRLYEEKAVEELGEDCARWLAEGRKAWEK
jgi:aryl sulfotransferase